MSAEFWMRLQMDFDLELAADAEETAIHEEIRPRVTHSNIEGAEQREVAC
jgi:plasmid maintenance system antidote protein VapI